MDGIKNADRFTGFADTYDNARPKVPELPVNILTEYLRREPELVVDIGCGTGLSSLVWEKKCKKLIGIEPSDDMLGEANKKSSDTLEFQKGYSHETGLPENVADIAVCSQSFHWMEPKATLKEINRILKSDGIFATIDCDWPPVSDYRAEMAFKELSAAVHEIEDKYPEIKDTFIRWDKNNHLKNIKESGYFKYTREILFMNSEDCDGERYVSLALSQGGLQTVLRLHPELIQNKLDKFKETVFGIFGDETRKVGFCYRMRIGIK